MIRFLLGILAITAIFVVIVVVLGVAISAMVRDSKKGHGTSGTMSAAALEVQSLLEPSKKSTVETLRRAEESEEDDAMGDPPEKA